jgi:hypothetical protein
MPQEMNQPSAEDTDNSADTDCDGEIMSASTIPTLLPEQGEGDPVNNNNNNEIPATTSSSSDDDEEQASSLLGDVTRVTFSPDTNGTPDCHASMTSNMDDDDKSNNSMMRQDSFSSQKTETKTQIQEQEERIIEHSTLEQPSTNTTSNTHERLRLRDPEGVMASDGLNHKFSGDTMRKIVEVEEVIPALQEKEINSPDPPSPAPMGEPINGRTSDQPEEREEKEVIPALREKEISSPDPPSPAANGGPMIGRTSDRPEEREEKQQEIVDSLPGGLSSETPPRKNMVLSSIQQVQEEPLSPLEEGDHLQLVDQAGDAEDPMMRHATLTYPPGLVAPAPHRTVAGPYNGYMQQQQQQYPPLLQRMDSNSFHDSVHEIQDPNQHHPLQNLYPNGFPVVPPMMQIPQLPPSVMTSTATTKRKIVFQLMEESPHQSNDRKTFLASFRRRPKANSLGSHDDSMEPTTMAQDRGRITVSWYEGTTSLELQEHVRRSVVRKIELRGTIKLKDMRILDESVHPPEGESLSKLLSSVYVCCGIIPHSIYAHCFSFLCLDL